jgi:NAD(P)H-dependent FMN reductase
MPIYSIDRQNEHGIPERAHAFMAKIAAADALLISFAEHNGAYTAAYKNLFDWCSRIDPKVFQGKAVAMLSTSPGPAGAGNVLNAATGSAPYFNGVLKASLSVPSFYDNFDVEQNALKNPEIQTQLQTLVDVLVG